MKTGYACWRISTWLKLGVLMTGVLMLFGCLGSLDEDADGQTGSFLVLDTLIPNYIGQNTADVDVVANLCFTGEDYVPEVFQDHMADITIRNVDLPNLEDGDQSASDVTITTYEVEYTLVTDDVEDAPNLDTEIFYDTWTIPANTALTYTVQMVPIFKKYEYVTKFVGKSLEELTIDDLEEVGQQEVYYVASFTFIGYDIFGHRLSIEGA
ncbi:hypothetical protein ACFL4G_10880, partial [Thermodesulfobacteriota bacterium]